MNNILGQLVVHRFLNEGVGVVRCRDTDSVTVEFESGEIITSTPDLIVKLTTFEAWAVRMDSRNIKFSNERIKKLRFAQAGAKERNDFIALADIGNAIKDVKRVVRKDYDFLKNTFNIDYKIEA